MEMEPIRKQLNDVDVAADGNKFGELPVSIVQHIFSFLGTMDVIRASAVSTNWRYLWTSMPHLDFYDRGIRSWSFREYDKYKDFVNWVLMTHDKSVFIKSCRLLCLNHEVDYSVDRWLHILVQKHVQELYLSVKFKRCTESPFALPRCLFASDSLEVLELNMWCMVFKTPSYAGFSRLKSLKLESALLDDQNLFQNFISSCPLLENLSLIRCPFNTFKVLDISLRNLRKLVIVDDIFEDCDDMVEVFSKCDLKITCPNLVYFDFTCPLMQSLSWGENPCFLQTAILYPFWNDEQVLNDKFANFVLQILRRVCHVEFLKLRMNILKCISLRVAKSGCFSTVFDNLKTLKLTTGMEACYIQSIIYLLKCTPNLQFLSVCLDHDKYLEYDYKFKCKMLDEDIACLTCHLKMVKLIDISDGGLELIRFFLKNGHVLEKMSIIWHGHFVGKAQRKSRQKVMKFPRSSSHVNVSFSVENGDGYDEL